jgi:spermidine synthase
MEYFLYGIFFLSGAAALTFETIWFRLAGLVFGNSVWSVSLILGGFMGGLALGNGLVSRFGDRVKRPVAFYAWVELAIAITGMSLVIILPIFEKWLTPIFRPFLDTPWALNILRLNLSFLLIVIPTTAMGATLPLLVKTLYRNIGNFGLVLGRLYGVNTLGAVLGALSGELFLIKYMGIRGTGLMAALLNFIAAFCSLRIAKHFDMHAIAERKTENILAEKVPVSFKAKRFLLAAFLSGGIILALEVVWFRFLLLFRSGTSFLFALMLSIILRDRDRGINFILVV